MILTPAAVASLALAAGFDHASAITAIAIAHAESGFDPGAVGDIGLEDATWGASVGLWQIRTLKAPTNHIRDQAWLLASPANQAAAAYVISGAGNNFGPWSTYTSGAYRSFVAEATKAIVEVLMADPAHPLVGVAVTADGKGYVVLAADGAVYAFGDALYAGRLETDQSGAWVPVVPK